MSVISLMKSYHEIAAIFSTNVLIISIFFIMLFRFTILLLKACIYAMPAPTPDEAPPPGGLDDPGYEESARAKNAIGCTVFWPPDEQTSLMQCKDVCGATVAQAVAAGNTSSVSCISINPQWQPFDGKLIFAKTS